MSEAIDAMRVAFGELSAGKAHLPHRVAVPASGGGVTLVMPGRVDVPFGLGAKIVSVFPNNAKRGLPAITGAVILLDAETGEVVAVLDGPSLTAIRTGAASGLATDLLARADASTVAILGSGVQARTQLEAVRCVRDIKSVGIWSRTRENAERFAEEVLAVTGADGATPTVRVGDSAVEVAREADVVCTATASTDALLGPNDVASGAHINAVGSFTPEMRELDPELIARARVVVDQRAAAMKEAGEVITAVRDGLIKEADIVEVGEIVNDVASGRADQAEVTVFKSVGVAVQDLVAGARVVATG